MTAPPHLSSYEEAERWLISLTDYERHPGAAAGSAATQAFDVERFREQLRLLGDPQQSFAVIHLAGTKGKGSTSAFLEAALRSCGYRTGLYTSPHLYRFTERIRVNGAEISEGDFCRLMETIGGRLSAPAPAADRSFRTVFEILTASAFSWFEQQQVEVAIIETGLGGRLDATNVFDTAGGYPLVDVITAIGLDHVAILGDTIAQIAWEKAGIIRPHARVVVAPQMTPRTAASVQQMVTERCAEVGAKAPVFVREAMEITPDAGGAAAGKVRFALTEEPAGTAGPLAKAVAGGLTAAPALEGEHQARNAATALMALVELEAAWGNAPRRMDPALVAAGLEQTCWPGRFQVVTLGETPIIVDGAHCAMSGEALGRACKKKFGDASAVVITGFMKDKAGADMLTAFFNEVPHVEAAVAVAAPSPRAASPAEVAERLAGFAAPQAVSQSDSARQALEIALRRAQEAQGYVVVFGSLYLVGPILDAAEELRRGQDLT